MNIFLDFWNWLNLWNWLIEPFTYDSGPDFSRAFLAGILVILCASTIGSWVVIRGMSYFADALTHGILPGVSIALTLDGNITIGAAIAALVMISGIRSVRRFSPLPSDVSIGLLFVGMLALTVVLISNKSGGEEELHDLLFGDILNVSNGNLLLQAISAGIILIGTVVFYRAFIVTTFDSTLSKLLNLRPEIAEYAMLILLGLAIVASFKAVGSLLLFSLLIAPPATAALIHKKTWAVMLGAVIQGVISIYLGVIIAFHTETSPSGTASLTSVAIFFIVLIIRVSIKGTSESHRASHSTA